MVLSLGLTLVKTVGDLSGHFSRYNCQLAGTGGKPFDFARRTPGLIGQPALCLQQT